MATMDGSPPLYTVEKRALSYNAAIRGILLLSQLEGKIQVDLAGRSVQFSASAESSRSISDFLMSVREHGLPRACFLSS